jgi:pimeloyl-ACP methyl ester carboxylesterase
MTPTESTATINGLKFRLLRGGRGTPVLFLHGANGFPGWLPLFERLSADHDVIVPEHPGFGASDDAPGLVNVSDFAFYYLDFLEQMNLPEVHVIGHSLGGWISAESAIRDRSRLASLTLLAPAGVRIKGVPTGDNFIWTPDEAARLVVYDQALAEQAIARVLTSEEQDQMIRTRLMAARLGWEPRWFNPHLEKWLHRVRTRTLVLWGRQDNLLPAAYASVWQDKLPNVVCEIIDECGHSPHIEQLEQVVTQLKNFL